MNQQQEKAAKLGLLPRVEAGRGWQTSNRLPMQPFTVEDSARTDELFAEVIDELLAENLEIADSLLSGIPVEAYLHD